MNCLVQNEPGVLSRVSGILAGRGFNIDSLVVCRTEIRDLSRMCIVLRGQDAVIEQARRQLEDLVSPRLPPRFVTLACPGRMGELVRFTGLEISYYHSRRGVAYAGVSDLTRMRLDATVRRESAFWSPRKGLCGRRL